jgi:hypothetical protein
MLKVLYMNFFSNSSLRNLSDGFVSSALFIGGIWVELSDQIRSGSTDQVEG